MRVRHEIKDDKRQNVEKDKNTEQYTQVETKKYAKKNLHRSKQATLQQHIKEQAGEVLEDLWDNFDEEEEELEGLKRIGALGGPSEQERTDDSTDDQSDLATNYNMSHHLSALGGSPVFSFRPGISPRRQPGVQSESSTLESNNQTTDEDTTFSVGSR